MIVMLWLKINIKLLHNEGIIDQHMMYVLTFSDIKFSYRNSSFKKDTILLSANFKLKKSDSLKIKKNLII